MRLSRKTTLMVIAGLAVAVPLLLASEKADWHFNGTVIEACSCPMFCPCYFNTEPATHEDHDESHFCKFNMAYTVNDGHHGTTELDGVKFWVAGDLGATWEDGTTDWAIVTFQKGTTKAQKDGVITALTHLFPVKWGSFKVAEDAEIEWTPGDGKAEAKLDGGEKAHIILEQWEGVEGETSVLQGVRYFGAPRNNGFKMMPNKIEAWKVGDKAFKFSGTTGFMITVDMTSADVPKKAEKGPEAP